MKLIANICINVCLKGYTWLMLLVNGQCQDQMEKCLLWQKNYPDYSFIWEIDVQTKTFFGKS